MQKTTSPSMLYAVCNSPADFFAQFESFVDALDSEVSINLGSLGVTSTQIYAGGGKLSSNKDYAAYKQETLEAGPALLTSIVVDPEVRAFTFRLDEWDEYLIPVELDPRMRVRQWVSLLAGCFELRSRRPSKDESSHPDGEVRDSAHIQAVRHFEDAAADVAATNAETASAAKAFLTDATRQLAKQHRAMVEAFAAEQEERQRIFQQSMAESERLDVREHSIVRREVLSRLEQLSDRLTAAEQSDAIVRTRRGVSMVCWFLMGLGTVMIGHSLFGTAPVNLVASAVGQESTLPSSLAWSSGWMPEITFGAGVVLAFLGAAALLRQLLLHQAISRVQANQKHRFQRDLLRMSWIAEWYLEALDKQLVGEHPDAAVPDVLLDRFSRSLFESSGDNGESIDLRQELRLAIDDGEPHAAREPRNGSPAQLDEVEERELVRSK